MDTHKGVLVNRTMHLQAYSPENIITIRGGKGTTMHTSRRMTIKGTMQYKYAPLATSRVHRKENHAKNT